MERRCAWVGLIGLGMAMGFAVRAGDASTVRQDSRTAARQQASVKAVCGSCHNLEMVDSAPRSFDAWIETVQAMVDRGATGTDEQFGDVLDYLHRRVTTINVNAAEPGELTIVLDVPDNVARAIVARRKSRAFTDLADLKSVRGVDPARLDERARLIFFR
jgi:competence protein ComEA